MTPADIEKGARALIAAEGFYLPDREPDREEALQEAARKAQAILDAVQPAEPSEEEVERAREALQAIRDTEAVNGQVVPEFIRAIARAALTSEPERID